MNKKDKLEQLKTQGWESMESVLDEHMPAESNRRFGGWFWWGAAASVLLLAISIPLILDISVESVPKTSFSLQSVQKDTNESNRSSNAPTNKNDKKVNKIAAVPSAKVLKPKGDQKKTTTGIGSTNGTSDFQRDAISKYENSANSESSTARDGTITTNTYENLKSNTPPLAAKEYQSSLLPISTIDPELSITGSVVSQLIHKEDITLASNPISINAMAFVESVWSFPDQFGFLSLGPGLSLQKGRWLAQLSAGISLPVPGKKSFSNVNNDFSEKYNFSNPEFDQNTASSGNAPLVYRQQYKSKPGLIIQGNLRYRIIPQLSIDVNAGNYWFKYIYEQRTFTNQILASSSTQPDLQNSIFYSGFNLNYHVNDHLLIGMGGRFMNVDNMENAFFVPALGLQYVL